VLGSVILFVDSSTMLLYPMYHRFLTKNWIYFHLLSFALNGIAIIGMFAVPESPKYLIGKQRFKEAKESLALMAKINGHSVAGAQALKLESYSISKPTLSGSIRDLLGDGKHRRNLARSILLWICNLMAYYTVYFHMRHLKGDYFFNVIAFGGCELAAYALGAFLTKRLGYKASLKASFVLTIVATLLYLLLRESYADALPVVMALAGFAIVWGCSTNWVANSELFPVIYASSTNGICNLFGRFASALAPLIAEIEQPYPMVIICFASVLATISLIP